MPAKTNILIYVPVKEDKYTDYYRKWVKNFTTILNVACKQIVKNELNISVLIPHKSSLDFHNQIDKSSISLILLFKKEELHPELFSLNQENSLSDKKILKIYCHSDQENTLNEFKTLNFLDEPLKQHIDLTKENSELQNQIWLKFLDIAFEVKSSLNRNIKKQNEEKQNIFLAETSNDQIANRENIIRELEHLGYNILPKSDFPKTLESFSQFVDDCLQKSFLSIHLLGNDYMPVIEKVNISSVELQNDLFIEIASKRNKNKEQIKRLVWLPPDIKYKTDKQRLYVESFKRNIDLLKHTEIIQAPIEIFKTLIKNKLNVLGDSQDEIKTNTIEKNKQKVYLIADNKNKPIYKNAKEELNKQKLVVLESNDTLNKIELIKRHYRNLIDCDAVLIIYTVDNEQWINSKLTDIIKSPGFGKKNKYLAKSILLDTEKQPSIKNKQDDLDLLSEHSTNISTRLTPFIEKIKQNGT